MNKIDYCLSNKDKLNSKEKNNLIKLREIIKRGLLTDKENHRIKIINKIKVKEIYDSIIKDISEYDIEKMEIKVNTNFERNLILSHYDY